jgi:hypothetical protein
MTRKKLLNNHYALIPLVFSGLLVIAVIFLLWQRLATEPTFRESLQEYSGLFIGISGFISFSILVYLIVSVIGSKRVQSVSGGQASILIQKMNTVRQIIEILLDSKLWLPGVKEYIDDEFEGLNFFEVKEFYKGKSKLAIEFLQEKPSFKDTETLYLELKSLLMIDPKQKKLPKNLVTPTYFKTEILEKWIEHKCGSGLWYYFGYKFGNYKGSLDIEAIFDRHQDKIMTLANNIDSELFEENSFNENFFSKLGEYINKDLIPQLFQLQNKTSSSVPKTIKYLYLLFSSSIIIGVLLPLITLLFSLNPIALIVSFGFVIGLLFFLVLTAYPFLNKILEE